MKCPPHICFVCDDDPGYKRIKKGKKFGYFDTATNHEVTDPKVISRIENLVIPPMWKGVWICKNKNGHIQVTGLDLKNRKQYLYHPDWVEYRQKNKFNRLKAFGRVLPRIRKRLDYYLNKEGFGKDRILAISLKMLDHYYLRIGNGRYETENKTFGLTTLRRKHLIEEHGNISLSYKAKSGILKNITIRNKKLKKLLREINELPGYEIFRYHENGKTARLDSRDVNEFISQLAEDEFTAKDFRTWAGTVKAIEHYPEALKEVTGNPRKKLETTLVRRVAKDLGNTVSVCRQYYIHPNVLETLTAGKIDSYQKRIRDESYGSSRMKTSEKLALAILENGRSHR